GVAMVGWRANPEAQMRQAALIVALMAALAGAGRGAGSDVIAQAPQGTAGASKENTAVAGAKRAKLAAAKSTYELMVAMAEHAETRVPHPDDRLTWPARRTGD